MIEYRQRTVSAEVCHHCHRTLKNKKRYWLIGFTSRSIQSKTETGNYTAHSTLKQCKKCGHVSEGWTK